MGGTGRKYSSSISTTAAFLSQCICNKFNTKPIGNSCKWAKAILLDVNNISSIYSLESNPTTSNTTGLYTT